MARPRAVVLRTAGTNCDLETVHAFELAGAAAGRVHVNRLAREPGLLGDAQIVALPGGFTYGDDVAAGKVMAVELEHVLGAALGEFVGRGGLVLGICNGFQILVKTGLLPDARFAPAGERSVTLTANESHRFEARWVRLAAPEETVCVFAAAGERLEMPVAHGEGRLVARDAGVLETLRERGQIVYRYIAADGGAPAYPADPNGSVDHIAGLCDPSGRVFGLMPHPERHLYARQHPRWTRENREGEGEGLALFRRAVAACA